MSSDLSQMLAGTVCGAYVISQNFPDLPFLRKLGAGTVLFIETLLISEQIVDRFPKLPMGVRYAEAGLISATVMFSVIDILQGKVPVDKIIVTALKTLTLGQAIPGAVWGADLGIKKLQNYFRQASSL